MNIQSRVVVILIVVILSVLLVWPNLGKREITVHFLPDLTEEALDANIKEISDYLTVRYSKRYSSEVVETAGVGDKKVKVLKVHGYFVQAAFLNELSRLNGVDSEKVKLEPMWMETKLKAKPFKLGLDLQGGMNLLMEADFEKLRSQLNDRYPESYIKEKKDKLAATKDEDEKEKIEFELKQIAEAVDFTDEKKREYVAGALEIIRSRIDKTGVSEPMIRMQGDDKIELSLPGVASPEQAKKIISSTARVEYKLSEPAVENGAGVYLQKAVPFFADYAKMDSDATRENYIKHVEQEIKLPPQYSLNVYWDKDPADLKGRLKPQYFMVLERIAALSGDDMTPNTYVGFDSERIQNTVNFQLTPEGTRKFAELTTKNRGRQLAILIDDKIRSAPSIGDPILTGSAMINGSFTQQEAKDLALIIKEGALPVPMKIVEEKSVGPSLGYESIRKGVTAVLIGLVAVAVFMILYYNVAGFIAVIGLILNLLFMSALLALMDFTITLPGLAGVVLTLGMAVDANVLIYERMREEIRRGKGLKVAISQGFEKATLTILDSNLTTMMAAIVLSQFGVGPIKGFAVSLFIGILASLFVALYVTQTLFNAMAFSWNFKRIPVGWGKYSRVG